MSETSTVDKMKFEDASKGREHMDVVIVGHVDHGKSTVIGRLLADTGSLPEGKLEQVKAQCLRDRKPFEYAFLLDALKAEQAQGITIDTARSFFKTDKRNYIIHDAPGHIEFLKNMVTGAARAEAALLVIDADEGIRENSKRHGYLISMLGIKQIAVLVNKMDLVDFDEKVFRNIKQNYTEFLNHLGVEPTCFIPISAREGVNIAKKSTEETPWYGGMTVLDQIDAFIKRDSQERLRNVFRMPVQDIYKFTGQDDDRRIIAGTITTGTISVGDEVIFLPSNKRCEITSIEGFNTEPCTTIGAGHATGFTMGTQIYIKPGEMMCRVGDENQPEVTTRFRANLFWMAHAPLVMGKDYKIKIGSANVAVRLASVENVIDASEIDTSHMKQQVDRHDVGEVILETKRPVAFDLRQVVEETGRFVIVDDFEIAGAGVVLEALAGDGSLAEEEIQRREFAWEKGTVTPEDRKERFKHAGKFILVNGEKGCGKRLVARALEKALYDQGRNTYYFGIANLFEDLDQSDPHHTAHRDENMDKLGSMARVMTDAGLLFVTTIADIDGYDLERLKMLNAPNELFVINIGENALTDNEAINVQLDHRPPVEETVEELLKALSKREIIAYQI